MNPMVVCAKDVNTLHTPHIAHRFINTLELVNNRFDFWLFHLPANYRYSIDILETIKAFFEKVKLPDDNAVIEFRDSSWWKQVKAIAMIGIVFCSVSALDFLTI